MEPSKIKIDKLINELCPEGVEFKELWEVTAWDKRFNGVDREKQIKVLSFKHISSSELKKLETKEGNIKLLATGKFDGWTTEELAEKYINQGEIISIPSGGSASIKYYNGKFVDSGNILASSLDNNILNLKYCFYYLLIKNELIESYFRGAGVKHPNMTEILKIKIPLPPLPIQEEIVKILDNFTELEAELEARKKQYEHYRDELLTFGDDVEFRELVTIVGVKRGIRVVKSQLEKTGKYPVYQNSMIPLGYFDKSNNKLNTPFIITAGAAGEIGYSSVDFWAADDCFALICPNNLQSKFLYYYLKVHQSFLFSRVRRASVPRLSRTVIEKIKIPLPPIQEQERIVAILDKFDALVNDISIGLPAELEARRKQYEYYREKLLTFKEKEISV